MLILKSPLQRLREHYNSTLLDDYMLLIYQHPLAARMQSDGTLGPVNYKSQRVRRNMTYEDLCELKERERLAVVEKGSTPPNPKRPHPTQRIPKPFEDPSDVATFEGVPRITRLTVHTTIPREAIDNKYNMLSAIMAIQCITGVRPTVIKSKNDSARIKLRKGMPIGCKVDLEGDDMFVFLDKIIEVVMPRIKEWSAPPTSTGDGYGNIHFGFGPSVMGLFPEIEGVYDNIPKQVPFDVVVHTNVMRDSEARLLLSGMGFPFAKSERDNSKDL
ncbi:ribosomal protein L5 [Ramicandelaber brevisporus]|nr:ribosomal protein L5 [Ramicandelaber brevisporus]